MASCQYMEESKSCTLTQNVIKALKYYQTLNIHNNEDKDELITLCRENSLLDDFIHIVSKHNDSKQLEEILNIMLSEYDEDIFLKQTRSNVNDHSGYLPSELYIKEKCRSLKDEILNNKIYCLSLYQLHMAMRKAKEFSDTETVKKIESKDWYPEDPLHYKI